MTIHETDIWAVVPVKGFSKAKSRLLPRLGRTRTSQLARAMLMDVLAVLGQSACFSGILVVTGDDEVVKIAERYGAKVLIDPAETGTNAAVRAGIRRVLEGGAGACVVVHSDLPFLQAEELIAVVDGLADSSVVIVPAQRDGGTNVLGMRPPGVIDTAFGQDSFASHLALIDHVGVGVKVLHLCGAAHDIDTPIDLDNVPFRARHTHAILELMPTGTICPAPHLLLKRSNS